MDASRWINKDFHAKEKKCQHNGSKLIMEEAYLFGCHIVAASRHKMALKF
jgi:hypothetical protein